jgi:ABC-type uncharacterized transport system substrate-binding protein
VLEGVQAIHVSQGPLFNTYRGELAAMALRARLPAVFGFREFAVAGGLISYATSLPDIYRRFAALVDKILKGTSPTCRSNEPRNSSWSSTSTPRRRSA